MIYAEIARQLNYHPIAFYAVLAGKRKLSLEKAKKLENITYINRLAWLYPEEKFNPYIPFRYQGSYPPDLSHLSGEALEFAKKIIEAFPERPPTREEFKDFKRKLRKNKNNEGGNNAQNAKKSRSRN